MGFSRQEYRSGLPFPPPDNVRSDVLLLCLIPLATSKSGSHSHLRGRDDAGCDTRLWFDPWAGRIPWRRKWQPTPVSLTGEFHGHRSLAGYSPWGHKESDTTAAPEYNTGVYVYVPVCGVHVRVCVCVCVCVTERERQTDRRGLIPESTHPEAPPAIPATV